MSGRFQLTIASLLFMALLYGGVGTAQSLRPQYLEDVEGRLTPDSLATQKWAARFVDAPSEVLSFGFNNSYYWVRLRPNLQQNETYILECTSPFVQYIDLYKYSVKDAAWNVQKGGYAVLWDDKAYKHRFPAFPLRGDDPSILYLRIKNNGLSFPLQLQTTREFDEGYLTQHLFFGILTGILFLVFFININLAYSLSSKVHITYSILVFGYLIFSLAGDGYLIYLIKDIPWLSRNYNSFSNVIEAYTYTAVALYGIVLFKIPKRSIWFGMLLVFSLYWSVHAFNYNNPLLSTILVEWGSNSIFIFSIALGIRGIILKQAGAYTYLIAYIVYFFFSLAEVAQYQGLIGHIFPVSYIVMGSQFEALILAYGLTLTTARERKNLQAAKLKAEEETIALIRDQQQQLQQLVYQKTKELQAANEELIASNEELTSQHDEINLQRKYVEELNNTIAKQNQDLEQEVRLRTGKLIEYNQQLEQFAFITAHNLRAPVARILGLANVIELEKDEATKGLLVEKIIHSCKDLDAVIHDINTILVIRNDHNPSFDTIDLSVVLASSLLTLQPEIDRTRTQLQVNFTEPTIKGITPYVQSIFTNLIHNAIKYKHPHRYPIISIQSKQVKGATEITLTDNGIGIDLEMHGEKVFGLYKRFHTHTEGRGMGLFLVKNQMEAMKGSVSVHSTPDKGTTFTLRLPR